MRIHFIGIGGIGVSALARYFLARGDKVSGSDLVESETIKDLRKMGAKIPPNPPLQRGEGKRAFFAKGGENVKFPPAPLLQMGEQVDLVIYSAAVPEDNSELAGARRRGIKCQTYAQALGDLTKKYFTIAVSGMHGKSTTTAMIGLIMEKAGLDPTVIVGTKVGWNEESLKSKSEKGKTESALNNGIALLSRLGVAPRNDLISYSNFRAGKSQYLVIEADEYDKSILNYWPKVLVLLNLEEEHLDTYTGGLPDIMETFGKYISHLSEDGMLVANEEDENIQKIFNENQKPKFQIQKYNSDAVSGLNLKIPGKHNLSNANAALAVARVLGIADKIAIEALNDFSGTWRRMEYKGELNGAKIYDDYAHHPTEIKATLRAAREILEKIPPKPLLQRGGADDDKPLAISDKRLWCVFQPHQYQRTHKLFEKFTGSFADADNLILLPIYDVAGRESESIKKKVNSAMLAEAIKTINNKQAAVNNKRKVLYIENFDKATKYLHKNLAVGDICVVMGAGDIYQLTERLFNFAQK